MGVLLTQIGSSKSVVHKRVNLSWCPSLIYPTICCRASLRRSSSIESAKVPQMKMSLIHSSDWAHLSLRRSTPGKSIDSVPSFSNTWATPQMMMKLFRLNPSVIAGKHPACIRGLRGALPCSGAAHMDPCFSVSMDSWHSIPTTR